MYTPRESDEFWSDSYRGHAIATLNRGNGWLVYLDHVLQHNKLFATAEAAAAWLRRQIDIAPTPSQRTESGALSRAH